MKDDATLLEAARAQLDANPDDLEILRQFAEAAKQAQQRPAGVAAVRAAYDRSPGPELYGLLKQICTFPELQLVPPPPQPATPEPAPTRIAEASPMTPAVQPAEKPVIEVDRLTKRSYAMMLDDVISYPVRDQASVLVLVCCSILLAIALRFPVGGLTLVILGGYVMAHLWNVMMSSADGRRVAPAWTELTRLNETVLSFLRWGAVFLACFLPAVILLKMATGAPKQRIDLYVGGFTFVVLGAFYYPMAMLIVGFSENGMNVLNAPVVFKAIKRIFGDYVVCAGVVAGTWVLSLGIDLGVGWMLRHAPDPILLIALLLIRALTVYTFIIQMRVIGLLYYAKSTDLGWVSRSTDEAP